MPWVKIDDGFFMHPKVMAAGNEGAGLFVRCLSYSGRHLTDGLIPEAVALSFAGNRKVLDTTVAAGLLERSPTGNLIIADYADYNPVRAQVEAEREDRRRRGQMGADKRWKRGDGDGNGHA